MALHGYRGEGRRGSLLDLNGPARLGAIELGHGDAKDAVGVAGRDGVLADGRGEAERAAEAAGEALAEPGRRRRLGVLGHVGRVAGGRGRLGGPGVVMLAGERERATGIVDRELELVAPA